MSAAAGVDTPLLMMIGVDVGLLCGLLNSILVIRFNLSSIGTMSLYRGITSILLGDQALNSYPESFVWFGLGSIIV